MLDKLPAPVRHLLIVAGATFGTDLVRAITAAKGQVVFIPWGHVLALAVNDTIVTVALAAAALWGTPMTRQYGVGAGPAD